MGWCMYEGALLPTLLGLAVCNATIPILPLLDDTVESACSPFYYVLHYLLFIKLLSYIYIRDWTVVVAQYSKFAC